MLASRDVHLQRLKRMLAYRRDLADQPDPNRVRAAHRASEIDALAWALSVLEGDAPRVPALRLDDGPGWDVGHLDP